MANKIINERKASNNFVSDGALYREPKPQEATAIAWTDIQKGGADAYYIEPFKDHKTIVLIKSAEASASKNVTFKKGTAYAAGDYVVPVPAGAELFVTLDSARFVDKNSGLIEVETDDTTASKIYVAVLEVR